MKKSKHLILFLILTSCFLLLTSNILAFQFDSYQYRIQNPTIDIGGIDYSKEGSYNLNSSLGQLAALEFSKAGYIVKAGFQYWHSVVPFTFSLSKTQINFGTLLLNQPVTDSTTLSVSYGGAGSYQVTAIEETRPKTLNGYFIEDTDCNSGCDETTPGLWNQSTATGFGYSMYGEDVPTAFTNCDASCHKTGGVCDDCYRPFPDRSNTPASENPAVVMSSDNVTVDPDSKPKDIIHSSTMTFKVNVDASQESGSYQTVINYVAIPGI